jgi:hypothetical protein
VAPEPPEGALRWLAYTLETEALMDEIEEASSRISQLVAAVKQYSYMDSAGMQEVELVPGSTAPSSCSAASCAASPSARTSRPTRRG